MAKKQTAEADRIRIRTLYFDGKLSQAEITRKTGFTRHQIRTALQSQCPRSRPGRPSFLSPEQTQELIEYISASKKNRRATYSQLSQLLFNGVFGEGAIRSTLYRHGYRRYVALRKPPISEATRQRRLAFAQEHVSWNPDAWAKVLWSDETWVTGGRHRKTKVTRRYNEAFNPTCIVERIQRKKGWMFWGSFSGITGKGPGLFWEKDWGTISGESYREYVVPMVESFIKYVEQHHNQQLLFMQDNAPGHRDQETVRELQRRGISIINWPPYSPDLNPIEKVWNKMKDYFDQHYGDTDNSPSYPELRRRVLEAWEAVGNAILQALLDTMQQRCVDVIAANGLYTKW